MKREEVECLQVGDILQYMLEEREDLDIVVRVKGETITVKTLNSTTDCIGDVTPIKTDNKEVWECYTLITGA
jgi:hypothetical protein